MENKEKYYLYLDDTEVKNKSLTSQIIKDEIVTYSGFFISEETKEIVNKQLNILCDKLNRDYGTKEFHFTDIYNRRGNFKNMKIDEIFDIVDNFVAIIKYLDIDIFTQTYSSSTLSGEQGEKLKQSLGDFCKHIKIKNNNKSISLLLTTLTAKKYLQDNYYNCELSNVVCDEGICKPGSSFNWENGLTKEKTKLSFESSKEVPLLQLADFCAWALSRQKFLTQKYNRTETDYTLLNKLSEINENYVNLPSFKLKDSPKPKYDKTYHKNL